MLGRVERFLKQLGPDEALLRQKMRELREVVRLAGTHRPDGPLFGGLSPMTLHVGPLGEARGIRWFEPTWGPQWLEVSMTCYEFASQYRWAPSPDLAEAFLVAYAVEAHGSAVVGADAAQAAVAPVELPLALMAGALVSKLREVQAGVAPPSLVIQEELAHIPEGIQRVCEQLAGQGPIAPAEKEDGGSADDQAPGSAVAT